MNDDIAARIAAGRERRRRERRLQNVLSILNAIALIGAVAIDKAAGWRGGEGVSPFVVAAAGCMTFGVLATRAHRREGIEQLLVQRAAIIAIAIALLWGLGSYIAWLVDEVTARPGTMLHIIGVGLMIGTALGDLGTGTRAE